jgi:cyclic-di-AMP phosphodiesterase PgpH
MKSLRARVYASGFTGMVLAFAFAFAWLLTQSFETWNPKWQVREGKRAPVTLRLPSRYFRITMLRNEYLYLATTSSRCPQMIERGTVVRSGECAGLVKAYESARRPPSPWRLLGLFGFFMTLGMLLAATMRHDTMERARLLRSQITIFGLLTVMMLVSKAILLLTGLPALVLPVTLVPLLTAYFHGKRLSLAVGLCSALLASSLVNFDIQVLLVHLAAGLGAVSALRPRMRSGTHLRAGAIAGWAAVGAAAITTLVFADTLNVHDDLAEHLDPRYSLWISALCSGLGSGLAAWLLTPLVGRLVGEVSRAKLLDLQDLDQRLLRVLRERAPGTWEHARTMANLAEGAAHAIGANALLVRAGAYYHDMGKSVHPELFIENQAGGPNPHDGMSPQESAQAIFKHMIEGARLLRQEGLPEDVVEFSYTHHGNGLLEYFWHKNMAAGNPAGLSEADFRYPGCKPPTRETGILMLVDAVEAAARTIDPPEKHNFEAMVQRIMFTKLTQGQVDETGLSLADLRIVANTLVDALVSMYHARIKYPWQTEDTGSTPATGTPATPVSEALPVTDDGPTVPEAPAPATPTPPGGTVRANGTPPLGIPIARIAERK